MTETSDERPPARLQSFAIVSGKGGSGKTLVATAMAMGIASTNGGRVLLIDADLGTAGLSYYLGFSAFTRAREGLAEFIIEKTNSISFATASDEVREEYPFFSEIALLPIGDHRKFYQSKAEIVSSRFREMIEVLDFGKLGVALFDCRGGIDQDSISVCGAVDGIIIVAETDAASIQTTQHLVNVLSDNGLSGKVVGFVLNKVMDDPSTLANAGRSLFRAEYLGAVPFDIDTTRAFIKGEVPRPSSLFCRHVFRATARAIPGVGPFVNLPVLTPAEFGTVSLRSPEVVAGNTLIAFGIVVMLLFSLYYVNWVFVSGEHATLFITSLGILGLLALSDSVKRVMGRGMRIYTTIFAKTFRRFSS